jgi:hypothetical protein
VILAHVTTMPTASSAWAAIDAMFASQSRARAINTRMALATAQKGTTSMTEYFGRMKTLADEMASAEKKLDDEELVSYILAELDIEYNTMVSAVATRVEPISLGELFTQLVGFEQRIDLLQGVGSNSSANLASRGRGGSGGYGTGRGHGQQGGHGCGRSGVRQGPTKASPLVEIGPSVSCVASLTTPSFVATKGLMQPSQTLMRTTLLLLYNIFLQCQHQLVCRHGVTDHITSELEKLTMKERYYSGDQVHMASGAGMEIKKIGRSIVHTPNQDLLNNVLYVPQANKKLASVHKLAYDNNTFFEIHHWYFFIKD